MTRIGKSWLGRLARWWGAGTPLHASDIAEVRRRQFIYLIRQTPLIAITNIANPLLVLVVFWNHGANSFLVVWTAALNISALNRLVRWHINRSRTHKGRVSRKAVRKAIYGSIAIGGLWGLAGVVLYDPTQPNHQVLLLCVIAGMGTGSLASLFPFPAVGLGFILPSLTPLTIRFLFSSDLVGIGVGSMMALYTIIIILSSRNGYLTFLENVRTQIKNRDLSEHAAHARANLADAIESIPEGFALFDNHDQLALWNDNFRRIFPATGANLCRGMGYEEMLRRSVQNGDIKLTAEASEQWIRDRLRRHRHSQGSAEFLTSAGKWVRVNERHTTNRGTVGIWSDITENKQRQEMLDQTRREAEEANRAKSEFLSLMSHELRTPLNAVLGFSEILMNESLGPHKDPRYREYSADIHQAGAHLLGVINDILDLSKIEAGRFELFEEPIDIRSSVGSVVKMLTVAAQKKQLVIHTVVPAGLPAIVADPRTLRQMLVNLLSNAVKFTPEGGEIIVSADVTDSGLQIAVSDNGQGMTPAEIPRAMQPFGQIDSSYNRNQEGTGLGLPLVKSLMELHGGRFDLSSQKGHGTKAALLFAADRIVLNGTATSTTTIQ